MENIIKKQKSNKGVLIGAIAAGAAIAGGLTWLLLTDKGKEVLENIQVSIKDRAADVLANQLERRTALAKDETVPAAGVIIG